MMDYSQILESWIEYLELEKLHNLKIDASKLKEDKRYNFKKFTPKESSIGRKDKFIEVRENKLSLYIEITEEEEEEEEIELYIGFPIIEEREKDKTKYIPLFIIKRKLRPTEENGKSFLKLVFDTEIDDDFFVAKPVLSRILEVNPQEFDELIQKKPLISLLIDLLKEAGEEYAGEESFEEIFKQFKKWLKKKIPKQAKVASFEAVVTRDKDFEYFEGQKIEWLLKELSKTSIFPLKEKSAAYKYLYENQVKSFEEYNRSSNTPWFGAFHTFSLSRGQALLLQKKAEGENLIAVQGPPGTGKTAVLMAVIASTLTDRALKIAKGEGDFPTIILVSSTANKAVENAAREFQSEKGIPEDFKDIPLYFEGKGFYFKGGKRKNIEASLSRVEELIKILEETVFNPTSHEEARREFLYQYKRLEGIKENIETLIAKQQELKKLEENLKKIRQEIKNVSNQINWNGKESEVKEVEKWIKKVLEEKQEVHFLKTLSSQDLYRQTIDLKLALQNQNIIDKLIELFTGRKKKLLAKFLETNRAILEKINFDFTLELNKALKELSRLEQLITKARTLLEEKPTFLELSQLHYWRKLILLNEEKLSLKKKFTETTKNLERIKVDLGLTKLKEQDTEFLTLWNEITVKENRELFIKGTQLLYFEILKRKNEIINTLEIFKLLMNRDNRKAVEEIRKIGIENFFRLLSLVYPVHFSSLHSSPYLFIGILKLLKEYPDFKPLHLLYIDEAAMALPHLSYPVLYFSEKSIAVGDPLQLEPVVSVPDAEIEKFHHKSYSDNPEIIDRFSPTKTSTYHRSARCKTGKYNDIGMACFLDTHRRCQKPIAELFKEVAGYQMLNIATPKLKGKDLEKLQKAWKGFHLGFINVPKGERVEKNTNLTEAKVIKELVKRLQKAGYDKSEIIVITPYVKQEKLLQKELQRLLPKGKIGTVHKFQGQEALVVIMSTVVQENDSISFIDAKPNLLNVAISRAKHLFIMVGSKKILSRTKYFSRAIKKIEKEGIYQSYTNFLTNSNLSG